VLQAYTFTEREGETQSIPRLFRFDETTARTVTETALVTLAEQTRKQLKTLFDEDSNQDAAE